VDTTPHIKAHIGGNHVTGLNNSNTAPGVGMGAFKRGTTVMDMAKM
jgi:hypothetical protein